MKGNKESQVKSLRQYVCENKSEEMKKADHNKSNLLEENKEERNVG